MVIQETIHGENKKLQKSHLHIAGITPARRAQLLDDLIDGVDLLLVIGR